MSVLVTTLALTLVQACPSYETCAFLPMNGSNPDPEAFNEIFEAASKNELGAASPEYPNIEFGPGRVPQSPMIACQILKPIAAAESAWQQFCPDTNQTVISFDCGFGVMQVTSGAASYGPRLASDTTWNVGAGTKILIGKWNGEFRGGPIGDSDPMILENWYYAVWAYNGFVFGNNPDNPQHPPNRPPYNGPNSLSRGSYPYQEIVWGYMHFPLNWRTIPKWTAVPVTYPAPGQVGMSPGPLPKLEPEHRSECKLPCEEDDCDFELIVDDKDEGFMLMGPATVSATGGYDDQYHYTSTEPPIVKARWSVSVPKTAVYRVAMFNPQTDDAASMSAPATMMARGGTLAVSFDQSQASGLFYQLGEVKLLKDQAYEVVLGNDSGESEARVLMDAVRIVFDRSLGAAVELEPCVTALDCSGNLVCVDSRCRMGCEDSVPRRCSPQSCNPVTGLCDEALTQLDGGIMDGMFFADAGRATMADASSMAPDSTEDACSCRSAQTPVDTSNAAGILALLGLVFRRVRRVRRRPCRPRYTS